MSSFGSAQPLLHHEELLRRCTDRPSDLTLFVSVNQEQVRENRNLLNLKQGLSTEPERATLLVPVEKLRRRIEGALYTWVTSHPTNHSSTNWKSWTSSSPMAGNSVHGVNGRNQWVRATHTGKKPLNQTPALFIRTARTRVPCPISKHTLEIL